MHFYWSSPIFLYFSKSPLKLYGHVSDIYEPHASNNSFEKCEDERRIMGGNESFFIKKKLILRYLLKKSNATFYTYFFTYILIRLT
jgi:hypothetical protein